MWQRKEVQADIRQSGSHLIVRKQGKFPCLAINNEFSIRNPSLISYDSWRSGCMGCQFERHSSPVHFTVSASKSTFPEKELILTRLAALNRIIKHPAELRKPRNAIFVVAETRGLEKSYSLESIKILQLSDFSTITLFDVRW